MTPLPLPPPSAVSATPPIAQSKSFTVAAPTAKSVMDARFAKRKKDQASETVKQKH